MEGCCPATEPNPHICVPTGIRTPVLTVKGWCPWPTRRWGQNFSNAKRSLRALCDGANDRGRTGGLDLGKVAIYQLIYIRRSGDDRSAGRHRKPHSKLLRSMPTSRRPARRGRFQTYGGCGRNRTFTPSCGLQIYSLRRPKPVFASHPLFICPAQMQEARTAFARPGSSWNRNLSITEAAYIANLPNCDL